MLTATEEQAEIQSSATQQSDRIVTTLYEVIALLNEQVGPEEDDAVTEAIVHLCRSGQLRFLDPSQRQALCCT